jgi:Protein of unknown function (DUF2934)
MTAILEEQIRQRAYRFFEERGCQHGHAVEDWLRAEREIRGFASRRGEMEAEPCPRDFSRSRALQEEKTALHDGKSVVHCFESFEIDGAPPREALRNKGYFFRKKQR